MPAGTAGVVTCLSRKTQIGSTPIVGAKFEVIMNPTEYNFHDTVEDLYARYGIGLSDKFLIHLVDMYVHQQVVMVYIRHSYGKHTLDAVGVAVCSEKDDFNVYTGQRLATARALKNLSGRLRSHYSQYKTS